MFEIKRVAYAVDADRTEFMPPSGLAAGGGR